MLVIRVGYVHLGVARLWKILLQLFSSSGTLVQCRVSLLSSGETRGTHKDLSQLVSGLGLLPLNLCLP